MPDRIRNALFHALLALMLAAGILFPLLSVLFDGPVSFGPFLVCLLTVLVLEAVSLSRRAAAASLIAGLCAGLFWLFSAGGLTRLSDVMTAVTLRFSGQTAALPLVSHDTEVFFALVVSALCWFAVLKKASYLPSLVLCTGMMVIIWLSGREDLVPWLIPALAAVIIMIILDRHGQVSVGRLLPFSAVLVLLALLFAPSGDGAFAPLRDMAENFRKDIMDRLFFTEPRDVFSLSAEGYYPQGINQLGGRPEINDHAVMQVSVPRTAYLRGAILNDYDGHTWRNTTGGRRYLWQAGSVLEDRSALFDENLPAVSADNFIMTSYIVQVRMLSDSSSTLFVPQRVRELSPGGELVPYFSKSSEIFITRSLQQGDTYSVSAPLFMAGDPGLGTLISAAGQMSDPSWESRVKTYTSLPSHLEQPLYNLADEITAGLETPYEKAFALQSWLSRNCRYTLDVQDQPVDVDFVTGFLMGSREGYCTYFASAMTVLCRMEGLPARYVEGYVAEPGVSGEAVVTGENAHAWTEVYFRGFGWLTFDATPRQGSQDDQDSSGSDRNEPDGSSDPSETDEPDPAPTETPPEDNPDESPDDNDPDETEPPESPDNSDDPEDPENPEDENSSSRDNGGGFPFLWILLLLVLLIPVVRILVTSPAWREKKAASAENRLDIWAQELFDVLSAEGFTIAPGETPMSFTRRVDSTGRFSTSLSRVGECLSLLIYSTAGPIEEDTDLLRGSALSLRKDMSSQARFRYWTRRIFIPLSRRRWTGRSQKQQSSAGT